MSITTCIGALLGIIAEAAAELIAGRLLAARKIETRNSNKERIILLLMSVSYGAVIASLIPFSPEYLYYFLILAIGVCVAITDMRHRIIPNELPAAVIAVTLLFGIPGILGADGFLQFNLWRSVLGMLFCFVVFSLPAAFSGKVGAGDVKLAAAFGFSLGFSNSLVCIVIMGALVLIYMILQKKLPAAEFVKSMIPMGPFISLSALMVMLLLHMPGLCEAVGMAGL